MEAVARSVRAEVRNPLLSLPGFRSLVSATPEIARPAMIAALREIQRDARERAEKSWKTHKAPMAVYWKAVGVYAGHAARAFVAAHRDSSRRSDAA